MHYQFHDDEEEFEPRITPRPIIKPDCFAVPSVPEVSLIFDKPMPQSLNGSINSSPASLARPIQPSGNTAKCVNYTSPSTTNQNSYATWREQNYPKKTNSPNVKHVSPLYKKAPNYTCVSQSNLQDKICDIQRPINVKPDSGICEKDVKSMRLDANNSYNRKQEDQLSSNKRHLLSHNSVQTATSNITDYTTRLPSNHIIVDAVKKDAQEHLQIPYTTYPYPFQPFYPPNYPNRDIDNNETVRTLLQLVNNQNEQIKTLQLQIDRLVRMQEESFRNKAACTCLLSHTNQMLGYPHSYNATSALNSAHLQSHDQNIKINGSQSAPVVENKDLESLGENKDNSKLEVAMVEQQLKKTFVEQKVSIGVMTSFEFAVQNGPLLTDSETHDEKEAPENGNNRLCAVNMYDSTESIPRYKNTLACKPGAAQLENIVEDNESYLSSSQQQSSHFNANSSMRDSDRYTPKQSDPYIMNTAENPKIYQRFATDTHKKNLHEGMYVRTHNGTDERMQDAGNVFMNAECGSTENATGGKAFIDDTNDNVMIDGRKGDYKANVNRQLHNIHLPAKHYQNYRNREYDIKQHTQVTDVDGSMTLSARNLKILERPLTPEPSIHVEMQDYSSDDSSDDKPKQTPKIGWTFYNNVLDQVNEILQKSDNMDDVEQNDAKAIRKVEQENDTVKAATLEQLKKLGISLPENDEHRELNDNNKTLNYDTSYYPRLDHHANMTHITSVVNETNMSMRMRELALKYLSDDQLAEIAVQKQESSSVQHLMFSSMQGTNMSLATMRYLERYKLLPGCNNAQIKDNDRVYDEVLPKPVIKKNNPVVHRFPSVQTSKATCPSRILDISALKRQPKLL